MSEAVNRRHVQDMPEAELLPSGARRCTAHNRSGERCGAPAVLGAQVCQAHGGSASQVRKKARLRLQELIDPAVTTLARTLTDRDATSADRLRAAEMILDRAGYPRGVKVTTEESRELLIQRLIEYRDRMRAEREQAESMAAEVVVEDDGQDGS